MKSRITVAAIIAVVAFFSLLYMTFEKAGNDKKMQKSVAQKLRVGFILLSDTADNGWNEAHYKGAKIACDSLGAQMVVAIDVPEETAPLAKVVKDMIADSIKIIVLTSYNYPKKIDGVIGAHPDVTFYGGDWKFKAPNYKPYFARTYQARYLAGIIAGAMTKTNHVGYVAAMKNSEVYRGIDAFAIGAQSVNPKVQVYLRWTHFWDNEEIETEAANALIDSFNVDVISLHQDRSHVVEVAEARGVYSIGNHVEKNYYSPKMLSSIDVNWNIIYKGVFQDFFQNKNTENMDYWFGLDKDAVGLAFYSNEIPDSIKVRIQNTIQRIKDGYHVFTGKIVDNKGHVRCEEGETISDDALRSEMEWLINGVVEQ